MSARSAEHILMIIVMIPVALSGNSRLNSEVSITIWSVLIMLHKNCRKPELKILMTKLALNQNIRVLDVASSILVSKLYSS